MYSLNPDKYNKFVITDVRFPNECKFVQQMGGTIYRVNRFKLNDNEIKSLHISEQFIPIMEVNRDIDNLF